MKGSEFKLISASWCSPCKGVKESLKNIEYETGLVVEVFDMDDHVDLVHQLRIRGVPTLVKFEDDVEVARLVGNRTLGEIKEFMGVV